MRSLSEPDIYTNIAFYEIDQPTWATQDEKEAVVKAVTFVRDIYTRTASRVGEMEVHLTRHTILHSNSIVFSFFFSFGGPFLGSAAAIGGSISREFKVVLKVSISSCILC